MGVRVAINNYEMVATVWVSKVIIKIVVVRNLEEADYHRFILDV